MDWAKMMPVIIPPAIALAGIVVGYLLKYFLDKKARFSSETATIKRDMYEKYVSTIMQFVHNPNQYTGEMTDKQTKNLIDKMREFHRQAILYSSPRVVNAFADFLQYAYKHPDGDSKGEYTMVLATNVFKEMRRDIGLSNRGLHSGAIRLIRPVINDYDQVIAPVEYSLYGAAKRAAHQAPRKAEGKK